MYIDRVNIPMMENPTSQPKVNVSPRRVFVNPVYTLLEGFSGIPQFIS
jgi:hypothetical protein